VLAGIDIAVATPPDLAPDPAAWTSAHRLAVVSGPQVPVVGDSYVTEPAGARSVLADRPGAGRALVQASGRRPG
jgi:hypothetical protein